MPPTVKGASTKTGPDALIAFTRKPIFEANRDTSKVSGYYIDIYGLVHSFGNRGSIICAIRSASQRGHQNSTPHWDRLRNIW